jgi:hypothetical protein
MNKVPFKYTKNFLGMLFCNWYKPPWFSFNDFFGLSWAFRPEYEWIANYLLLQLSELLNIVEIEVHLFVVTDSTL